MSLNLGSQPAILAAIDSDKSIGLTIASPHFCLTGAHRFSSILVFPTLHHFHGTTSPRGTLKQETVLKTMEGSLEELVSAKRLQHVSILYSSSKYFDVAYLASKVSSRYVN